MSAGNYNLFESNFLKSRLNEHYHQLLHIQISLRMNLRLRMTFLDQIYSKKVFPVSKQASRISQSNSAVYLTKFAKKVYFSFKTGQMNISLEFSIFELV